MDERIVQAVTQIRNEIEQAYVAKGLMASGNFAHELQVIKQGNNIKIVAPRYVGAMETGRIPGRRPPLSVIKQWIIDKNRQGANIPLEAAYPIAKMIGEEGIRVPNKHNPGGVVSGVLTPARIITLQDDIIRIVQYVIIDALNIK